MFLGRNLAHIYKDAISDDTRSVITKYASKSITKISFGKWTFDVAVIVYPKQIHKQPLLRLCFHFVIIEKKLEER